MKKYLTLIAGALMIAACSNDEATTNEVPNPNGAIAFTAATENLTSVMTRAEWEIGEDEDLKDKGFGVFGFYTGKVDYENMTVTPDFMWNQKVVGTGTAPDINWTYNPVKYWPNEEEDKISFFAYAPYQAVEPNHPEAVTDKDQCIFGMSRNVDKGDAWVSYRIAEHPWGTDLLATELEPKQIDLLYGIKYTKVGTDPATYEAWLDQSHQDYKVDEKLKFTFEHALACVGDKVTLKLSDGLKALLNNYSTIRIDKLTMSYVNFTNKARLVLNPSFTTDGVEPNWKEIISGELTTDRSLEATNYPQTNSADALSSITFDYASTAEEPKTISEKQGLLYIPMQIRGTEDATVTATLDYTIIITATGQELPGTVSSTFKLKEAAGGKAMTTEFAGKKLGIALTLTDKLDLLHQVYTLGGTATEPSYSRLTK